MADYKRLCFNPSLTKGVGLPSPCSTKTKEVKCGHSDFGIFISFSPFFDVGTSYPGGRVSRRRPVGKEGGPGCHLTALKSILTNSRTVVFFVKGKLHPGQN